MIQISFGVQKTEKMLFPMLSNNKIFETTVPTAKNMVPKLKKLRDKAILFGMVV